MNGIRWAGKLVMIALLSSSIASAIGVRINATSGGTLEDAILVASVAGAPPRAVVVLGDLNLSLTDFVYNVAVDPAATSWWLIGHKGSTVVYSSVQNLAGVDLYAVQPYTGMSGAWNIPVNLDGYANYVSGPLTYSLDWWAQTVNNHGSHVAADGSSAGLWSFASPGVSAGTVAVNLHSNAIPGVPAPGVPDAGSSAALLLGALAAMASLRRRFAQRT